jgi:hypothetical protein
MTMRRVFGIFIYLVFSAGAFGNDGGPIVFVPNVDATNNSNSELNQNMQGLGYSNALGGSANAQGGAALANGGDATSGSVAINGDATSSSSSLALTGDASSSSGSTAYSGGSNPVAVSNISTTSIANYKSRTPPLSAASPYLPYWTHGGWGTLKAYFPNGPSGDDQVYERAFDPRNPEDMKELRGVLAALPYEGPTQFIGGLLNGVHAIFGGPDNFHHGRGFEISSSFIHQTRPKSKPLLVFIDSNVDRRLLRDAGYAYVGKVSIEGNTDRNWDHVYDAAVAEALMWDVDVLLVSGGMKGVTVGSSTAFPTAGFGYSQTNYSISLFGGGSKGITEGKGKALLSGDGYRFWPKAAGSRQIPPMLYDRIRATPAAMQQAAAPAQQTAAPAQQATTSTQQAAPARASSTKKAPASVPAQTQPTSVGKKDKHVGVEVSRELYDMAGFEQGQRIENIIIK